MCSARFVRSFVRFSARYLTSVRSRSARSVSVSPVDDFPFSPIPADASCFLRHADVRKRCRDYRPSVFRFLTPVMHRPSSWCSSGAPVVVPPRRSGSSLRSFVVVVDLAVVCPPACSRRSHRQRHRLVDLCVSQ